ncbi:MAG: phospholipase A [Burkholderiales bacterium]
MPEPAATRATPASPGTVPGAPLPGSATPALPTLDEAARLARDERRARGGTLGERWELDPGTRQGRFLLRPYKPMYVLPVHWSNSPNQTPTSEGAGNSVSRPQGLSATEAAFQISLKSKVWETVGDTNLDIWLGYTQKSHWQVYTPALSRPFRETNYEPEIFGIWGLDQPLFAGWRARFVGLGLNHQSNGRSEPLSRSWNRVIVQAGFENGDWSLLLRPWWRLREAPEVDDNPGIENWIGRGELVLTRRAGAHQLSLQLRHSLKTGDLARGSATLDWAFPLSSYLKGHVQLFSGYGETLIDFNHRQTTIGLGVSLVEWQ